MCRKARAEQSLNIKWVGDGLQIQFDIIKDSSRGYIVKRIDGDYEQHAHVSTLNGCRLLINLIHKGMMPTSKYLQDSARRLLTEEEYKSLRQKKQRYVNVNKGMK